MPGKDNIYCHKSPLQTMQKRLPQGTSLWPAPEIPSIKSETCWQRYDNYPRVLNFAREGLPSLNKNTWSSTSELRNERAYFFRSLLKKNVAKGMSTRIPSNIACNKTLCSVTLLDYNKRRLLVQEVAYSFHRDWLKDLRLLVREQKVVEKRFMPHNKILYNIPQEPPWDVGTTCTQIVK